MTEYQLKFTGKLTQYVDNIDGDEYVEIPVTPEITEAFCSELMVRLTHMDPAISATTTTGEIDLCLTFDDGS